jgi:hypothetical protein
MDKNVVFDLDETIGYFDQIIDIMNYTKINKKTEIFELFVIFPQIFRTNVFEIFHYLVRLKKEKKIKSVILYSNNNNDNFIQYIIEYIHQKLNYILFDLSISLNQTRNKNKNKNDLLLYSNGLLNHKSSIFFIDDKEYEYMKNVKYYIKCEAYQYVYNKEYIEKEKKIKFENEKYNHKNKISQSIYSIISKEIINKIRLFTLINV